MGEKMDKAVEEVRKAVEEEMKAARAAGKGVTTSSEEKVMEGDKVVKVITRLTTTITDEQEDLDSSPQVNDMFKTIRRLEGQVEDQAANIRVLFKRKNELEGQVEELQTDKKKLKLLVKFWQTAAECEKPRGSCRACKTINCFFKKKAI
jgi:DNA repair exonuclease SbcCD ATPase subunit